MARCVRFWPLAWTRLCRCSFINVGVEIGQLLFIGTVFAIKALWQTTIGSTLNREFAQPLIAYAVGAVASFWFIDRLIAFAL